MSDCKHCDHDDDHSDEAAAPAVLNASVRGDRVTILAVSGMDCADEVKVLNETLGPLDGVRSVEANLMAARIVCAHRAAAGSSSESLGVASST